ncbi:MAG: hypothetical protein WCG21_11860 [Eubacteriales bacterium]
MIIPQSFKDAQTKAFQDKTIAHHARVETTGALGGKTSAPVVTSSGSYLVNLQVIKDALEAQQWGLTVNKDCKITRSGALAVPIGDYIKYGSDTYRIIENIASDSHVTLYGKKV